MKGADAWFLGWRRKGKLHVSSYTNFNFVFDPSAAMDCVSAKLPYWPSGLIIIVFNLS
jgi:hypothetical protein